MAKASYRVRSTRGKPVCEKVRTNIGSIQLASFDITNNYLNQVFQWF
ncbi:hypothetical protein SRABI13_04534 [Erwinia aphidicola]|nr:hypothetical protein SRABI13_04534 [Erwinia aphidicola]